MTAQAVVRIKNKQGLHARPVSRFVQVVASFKASATVRGPDGTVADGASIFSMMTLAAGPGTELVLETAGEEEQALLSALIKLVGEGFGEE